MTLAPDHPVEFDAWDLERWTADTARSLTPLGAPRVIDAGPLWGSIAVDYRFGRSTMTTTFTLRSGSPRLDIGFEVDWREDEKLLAVEFPFDVHTPTARCGIQFGHVERPRHTNTTWDFAKFEVCAHRWVDVAEPSFGVAVLNDGRFGHSVHGDRVRVSLLRAASFPDPTADRGRHACTLAVFPHGPGLSDVVREADIFNNPLRLVDGAAPVNAAPALTLIGSGVEVSAVKPADDGSGDMIVRLYEALGDRSVVHIESSRHSLVARADLFESRLEQVTPLAEFELQLRPFELVTLRFSHR